jgi:hypothetical protein
MNAQNALELAYDQINSTGKFTYGFQYFERTLGYLVFMVNETYDTFTSSATPYFYWEVFVNGKPQNVGIDGTMLNAGDVVGFRSSSMVRPRIPANCSAPNRSLRPKLSDDHPCSRVRPSESRNRLRIISRFIPRGRKPRVAGARLSLCPGHPLRIPRRQFEPFRYPPQSSDPITLRTVAVLPGGRSMRPDTDAHARQALL